MTHMEMISMLAFVRVPRGRAWELWTQPEHIVKWCFASDDWHAPRAENDLRVGGRFLTRMEAKDGNAGFDFAGTYAEVVPEEHIVQTLGDGRKLTVFFAEHDGGTEITETLETEDENPVEMQRAGSQAILDNFKEYAERETA